MPESRLEKIILKGGRQHRPCGYSFLTRKCDPEERLRVRRYLTAARAAIVEDLGGEEALTAAKIILIDRCISLLAVLRGIEEYFKENLLTDNGELPPALSKNFISYNNSLRLNLCSLGLERHTMLDPTKDLIDRMAKFDEEKAREDEEEAKKTLHKQGKPRPKVRHSLPAATVGQGIRTG